MEKRDRLSEKWYNATDEEINNMSIEEAKNIIIEHIEWSLTIVEKEFGPRKWYAKAMELVLPIIKGDKYEK